ncbi:MAG: hypothetical protein KBT04_02085 [Bacteroidales bacterium]|nr:hypothetical protein [Candidatus Colimorpha onthohippi]
MFYTPKPRQFHYEPRFYDPEKERWEELKRKYAATHPSLTEAPTQDTDTDDDELRYFQDKVRQIDRSRRQHRLGLMDLFRKRKMPKFNYQPRFQQGSTPSPAGGEATAPQATADADLMNKYANNDSRPYKIHIRRRYDISDTDYMKPMSAGKIMLYGLLTFLLLYWILF